VPDIQELDQWLAESERLAGPVIEGTEKSIVWSKAGKNRQTPLSIVYLHGFSASRQETAPLCDQVASSLGANLFYMRLRGHGINGDSLGAASEQHWLEDTCEALKIGARIGERVIAVGASTGATLLAWLAAEQMLPYSVVAMVFISPNYGPVDRRTEIFNRRFGLRIAKKLVGPIYRWEPRNEQHKKYWTCEFPLEALATMMKCVVACRASVARHGVDLPVLTLYSRQDKTVLPSRTEDIARHLRHRDSRLVEVNSEGDANHHILAGDILAPEATDMVRDKIVSYIEQTVFQNANAGKIIMKNSKPVVVVLGAESLDQISGLSEYTSLAEFRFASDAQQLRKALNGADVLLGWDFKESTLQDVWSDARDLRWIQWPGAGVDAVLFPELVESDVLLTNMRGVFDRAMAEFALGQILMFSKGFVETFENQRNRIWKHRLTETINDRQVLIVGVGSIGREIARLLKAVGMSVTGVGRRERSGDQDFGTIKSVDELNTLLPSADFVVLITPLTDDTRKMFGRSQFSSMKESARFINLGRGALVDETALLDALSAKQIAGAALDVFMQEPLPADSPFWSAPDCIVSPHMSGDFVEFEAAVIAVFGDNLRRYIEGGPLRNLVNKVEGFVS